MGAGGGTGMVASADQNESRGTGMVAWGTRIGACLGPDLYLWGPEMEQREGGEPKFKPGKIELMGIQRRSRRPGLGFSICLPQLRLRIRITLLRI